MLDFDKKTRTADYNSRHESYQNDTPDGTERETKTYTNRVICCPLFKYSSSFVYHRLILLTWSVGAMRWSMAQLRRGQFRMVVDAVGSY